MEFKPYHITINNLARTYNEQLEEYEKMSQSKAYINRHCQ